MWIIVLRLSIILLLFCSANSALAQVKINEVCSSNQSIIVLGDGSSPDWIELYNNSPEAVELTGYYLSDNIDDTTKWQFSSAVIPFEGYLIVYANDENQPLNTPPETSFRLSQDGESLYLFSPQKLLIDSIKIPYITTDYSYGCDQDGSSQRAFFSTPTPNASNNTQLGQTHVVAYLPQFSVQSGVYDEGFRVSITSADSLATIKYTVNGSEPDINSFDYEEPLFFGGNSSVVKAKAFVSGLEPSKTVTANYVFLEEQHLPIVCISTHPDYFFHPDTGIYVRGPNASPEFPYLGANFWSDTEVPANVQWIDNYGQLGFDQTLGVRIHGGSISRTRPMRSLRLLAKDKYGKDEIEYPLFSTKIQPKNKRFLLRNSGSDYLKTMFRDGFIHNVFISNGLHVDAVCFNPVEVYLNGNFWGIHNAREKVDRFYVHYNYGYDSENVDMLEEQDIVMEGSFDLFNQHEALVLGLDLTENENWAVADSLFDLLNIADYYVSQTFINNLDWPYNNLKYWRARVDTSKWRYVIFDLDATLGGVTFAPVEFDALERALGSFGDTNRHVILFRKLLENREYFEYYINRYCDLRNTVFSAEKFSDAVDMAAARIEKVIPRHFERWSPDENDWYEQVEIVREYVEERPPYAIDYLQKFYNLGNQANIQLNVYPPSAGKIKLNSISLKEFPFKGVYFDDIGIRIQLFENPGFEFSHWESNRVDFDGSSAYSRTFFPQDGDEVTAVFTGNSLYNDLTVHPNPSTGLLNVSFVSKQRQNISVFLTDLAAATKYELHQGEFLSGTQKVQVQTPADLAGVFLLTVQTEDEQYSKKVVLLKP